MPRRDDAEQQLRRPREHADHDVNGSVPRLCRANTPTARAMFREHFRHLFETLFQTFFKNLEYNFKKISDIFDIFEKEKKVRRFFPSLRQFFFFAQPPAEVEK